MITEVIPGLWKYLGCGPVLTVQCTTVLGVTPVRCSTTELLSVSCLPDATTTLSSSPAKSGPRDSEFDSSPPAKPCLLLLPLPCPEERRQTGLTACSQLTHIMTSYKPNSVKDNKDKCCRSGQGLRALSVLTRGERNRLDRQHRKGKTFVAVVRAAVIWPMRCRDRGHVTLTNDVLAPCPDIAPALTLSRPARLSCLHYRTDDRTVRPYADTIIPQESSALRTHSAIVSNHATQNVTERIFLKVKLLQSLEHV